MSYRVVGATLVVGFLLVIACAAAATAKAQVAVHGPTPPDHHVVRQTRLPRSVGKVEEVIPYGRTQMLLLSRYPPSLVRVSADGTLDRTFGNNGRAAVSGYGVTVLPGGKILVAGEGAPSGEPSNVDAKVTRLLPNGRPDPSFGNDGSALVDLGGRLDSGDSTAVAPDGDILVGGARANEYNEGSDATPAIARLNPNGSVDRTFGDDGVRVLPGGNETGVYHVAATPGGGILGLTGAEEALGDELWKLGADGSVDRSFGKRGVVSLLLPTLRTGVTFLDAMEGLPSGRVLLAGTDESSAGRSGSNRAVATRLLPNGKVDRSYGHHGWAVANLGSAFVDAMTPFPGRGLLLTASSLDSENLTSQLDVLAFAGDGTPDPRLGHRGRFHVNLDGWSLAESAAVLGQSVVVAVRRGRDGPPWLLALPKL
jgi:uncharacterized delta-60 repeat protein